jgi:hypothetical protein
MLHVEAAKVQAQVAFTLPKKKGCKTPTYWDPHMEKLLQKLRKNIFGFLVFLNNFVIQLTH